MAWSDQVTALDTACVMAFGEAVTLPGGVLVSGVFYPFGQGPRIKGLSGIDARISPPPQPELWLSTPDGAALVEGDRVTVRGVEYLVSRTDDDEAGMWRLYRPSAR